MGQVVRASMRVCYSQTGMFDSIVCATEATHISLILMIHLFFCAALTNVPENVN